MSAPQERGAPRLFGYAAPHYAASVAANGAARAAAPQQPPRLAPGHEMIGRRLLRFRRGGGDTKEKVSGRVRGVRDDPGRGLLFSVLWDDRPGAAEELTRDELDVYVSAPQQPPLAPQPAQAAPHAPAAAPLPAQPPPPPAPQPPPAQTWGTPVPVPAAIRLPQPPPAQPPAAPAPRAAQSPPHDSPESDYVGVRLGKNGKWKAEIRLPQPPGAAASAAAAGGPAPKRGKLKSLGLFDTAAEAASAYDAAARVAGRTVVNVPIRPWETQAVKPRKRERPPKVPQEGPPQAGPPGAFPALDAQRRALAAASAQAASRPAPAPPAEAPPVKRQRVDSDADDAAPAALIDPPTAAAAAAAESERKAARPTTGNPGNSDPDELAAALARHGLGALAPRFAAERLDAALLRAAGPGLLRGREAQERLGLTTLGDVMRLGLVLKTLGVGWD